MSLDTDPQLPNATAQKTFLLTLPNELLTSIVEFIGPPDISCCDPGWLVVPAVCHRLRDVAEGLGGWKKGWIDNSGYYILYDWRTPATSFAVYDVRNGTDWVMAPVYKGGNIDYASSELSVRRSMRQPIDGYLATLTLRDNLRWMSSIRLDYSGRANTTFSGNQGLYTEIPSIVAPALQDLRLSDYILDWHCNGLKTLIIHMSRRIDDRYSPTQLFARMSDSRHTLEDVELTQCLLPVPEDGLDSVTITNFPSLDGFVMSDMPHEAGWFCQRIGFPEGCPPIFHNSDESGTIFLRSVDFLRSLVCEYARSVPCLKPSPSNPYGELNTLTFRDSIMYTDSDCFVTASRLTSLRLADLSAGLYAGFCAPRYAAFDTEQNRGELNKEVPGIEPAFIASARWTLDEWSWLPIADGFRYSRRFSLHGIQNVFVDGDKRRLFRSESSAQVWADALRHLPNVRALYIYAPSTFSLTPLAREYILPALETLWLGWDAKNHEAQAEDEQKFEIDARVLLDIVEKRDNRRGGKTRGLKIQLLNVQLVGDPLDVQKAEEISESVDGAVHMPPDVIRW